MFLTQLRVTFNLLILLFHSAGVKYINSDATIQSNEPFKPAYICVWINVLDSFFFSFHHSPFLLLFQTFAFRTLIPATEL